MASAQACAIYLTLHIILKVILTNAALLNVTVDDYGTDPRTGNSIGYSSSWNIGQTCSKCTAHPNPALIHNMSWHDSTMNTQQAEVPSVLFNFTGSALYVYGILSHAKGGHPTGTSNLSFYIDDQIHGNFSFTPDGVGDFTYSALLFSVDTLPYGPHGLVVQNGYWGGPMSLLLFDYLIYSTMDSEPNSTASPTTSQATPQTTSSISSQSIAQRINRLTLSIAIVLGVLSSTGGVLWYVRYRRERFRRLQSPSRASSIFTLATDSSRTLYPPMTPVRLEVPARGSDMIVSVGSNVTAVSWNTREEGEDSGELGSRKKRARKR